ncbi:ATP-binding protein [Planctomycetota bacterium]
MKLGYKLILLTLMVGVVPLAIAGNQMTKMSQEKLVGTLAETRTDKAYTSAHLADTFMRNITRNLAASVYNVNLKEMSKQKKGDLLVFLLSQYPEVGFLTLLDDKGSELARGVPGLETRSPEEYWQHVRQVPFDVAMKEGRIAFSKTYVSKEVRGVMVTMATPLPAGQGVLAAEVNLSSIQRMVLEEIRRTPRIGFVGLVIDGEGNVIAHNDPNTALNRTNMKGIPFVDGLLDTKVRILGSTEFDDDKGVRMLGTYCPMKETDWWVVIHEPRRDVYASARMMRNTAILWICAASAFAILGGFFLTGRIVKPVRVLVDAATQIGSGNYDYGVQVRSRDEVGFLGKQFESMRILVKEHIDNLDGLVKERTRELEEANSQLDASRKGLRDIMDHIQQSIFTVSPDLTINPDHSRYVEHVYQTEVAGKRFTELLSFKEEKAEQATELDDWFNLVFNTPDVDWDMMGELAMKEATFERTVGEETSMRYLTFEYSPILKEDEVTSVMVITQDVTETRELQEEVERRTKENKENIEQIAEIIQLDTDTFLGFISESETTIAESRPILERLKTEPDNTSLIDDLFRKMHTLKGNARSFKLELIGSVAHEVEDSFDAIRKGDIELTDESIDETLGKVDGLEEMLQRAVQLAESVMGGQDITKMKEAYAESGPAVKVSRAKIDRLASSFGRFQNVRTARKSEKKKVDDVLKELQECIDAMRRSTPEQLINRLSSMVTEISSDLGKSVNSLVVEGADTEVDITILEKVGDPLVHIMRNSVDHGVESPEKRKAAGKPEAGTVTLSFARDERTVTIEIKDDGNGIDPARVGEKAVKMKLTTEKELAAMDEKDIIDFIFAPGFSSAEKVTEISGRGVGMDVVKTGIADLRGEVEVWSKLGEGSRFTLTIPETDPIVVIDGDETGEQS